MQTNLEMLEGLSRKIIIQAPADLIDQQVNKKLKELVHQAKLPGFRPGKVPVELIRQKFGKSVRSEVIGEVIESSYKEALSEQKLVPVSFPKIEITQDVVGQPFEYQAVFEVHPEITLQDLTSAQIESITVDIRDQDVDWMIERLRVQKKANWVEVDRASQTGDRVTVSFEGFHNGKSFEGGSAQEIQLELGLGTTVPGFEEGFTGYKAGDTFDVNVSIPKDYHTAEIAGEPVVFHATLHKVETPELPEIDVEFIKDAGIESGELEDLRKQTRTQIAKQVEDKVKEHIRGQALEKLLELNPIDIPNALVEKELAFLKEQSEKSRPSHVISEAEEANLLKLAKRRVHLGLLFSEWIEHYQLVADAIQVEKLIKKIANAYPENMRSIVVDVYKQSKELLKGIEEKCIENQVIEQLISQVTVTEKVMTYSEFKRFKIKEDRDN